MIKVEQLRFTWPGNNEETIRSIGFNIAAGEIFGFLGPSGAGKSTTQKILIGVLPGFSGSVSVDGKPLSCYGPAYYEQIGVAFEFPNLYTKFTALENLQFFRSLYRGATNVPRQLLEQVGLADAAQRRVSSFSKGMKMRLNFCRALLNRPRLLFLDEPTSGLDPVTARLVCDLIREQQQQGCTVFLTTHNMQIADTLCDRVAFMVDGTLPLTDSPARLKQQYGERAVLVGTQTTDGIQEQEFPLDGLADNTAFLKTLRSARVETIHSREATLDDIFIRVTGRSLR